MNYDYCGGTVYTIQRGDTLYSISGRFNVPLALILRANPYVDIYNLQIGDQLCIPDYCKNCMEHTPATPGEGTQPLPMPDLPWADGGQNQPATPGEGTQPLPMPNLPWADGGQNQPATPGEGTQPLPMPNLPWADGGQNQPAAPGEGIQPQPMPNLPGGNGGQNQPATPEEGTQPLPMPNLPWGNGGQNQSATQGGGTQPLPMPNLPWGNGGQNQPATQGGGTRPLPTPSIPECSTQEPYVKWFVYVIRDVDTLQDILNKFNISLADLLLYNNLDGIMLKPGMTVKIPNPNVS